MRGQAVKKTLLLAIKDLKLAFRDRAAILLMLAAPFLLTLGLGLITGRLSAPSGSSSGLRDIPVLLVNQDDGELGQALVEVFQSDTLAGLLEPRLVTDVAAARQAVDEDRVAGLVLIPAGFSHSVFTPGAQVLQIELYASPSRPTSAGIVEAILEEFLTRVEEGRITGMTATLSMLESGWLLPAEAEAVGRSVGRELAAREEAGETPLDLVVKGTGAAEPQSFDVMAFMAPGMALLFLMFTATYGGRTFLAERRQHTLQRLLTTPTTVGQVFGGKMLGIFLTGVLQLGILIGASSLLFNLKWGDFWGVVALILCASFAATGWGLLITAFARTPSQVASIGSALMLTFGILGGSFINLEMLPPFVQILSRLTPNAWGLDGFTILALGGTLADLGRVLTALLGMGAVLFVVSVGLFARNRNLVQ